MGTIRYVGVLAGALAAVTSLALSGCGRAGGTDTALFVPAASPSATASTTPAEITITPAHGATDVPASAEITASARGATITTVSVAEVGGLPSPAGGATTAPPGCRTPRSSTTRGTWRP